LPSIRNLRSQSLAVVPALLLASPAIPELATILGLNSNYSGTDAVEQPGRFGNRQWITGQAKTIDPKLLDIDDEDLDEDEPKSTPKTSADDDDEELETKKQRRARENKEKNMKTLDAVHGILRLFMQ